LEIRNSLLFDAWNFFLKEIDLSMPEERKPKFTNLSNIEIKRVYTPDDAKDIDYSKEIGLPGEFPFTRGIHPTMYRGRLWTMRQFAGFGTAEETNKRFKYLLQHGETGLSTAFDMPTLMGYDSDHPMSQGEIGRCGVAIDTIIDMDILFDGIPLDKVTVSMTINAPAAVIFAMYIAVAEKRGIPLTSIGGTIQNDMLKEYIAQKEWIYPPGPALRLIRDTIVYSAKNLPKWHPISISGYHIREAGSTAAQELAFTLYDGLTYVEDVVKAVIFPIEFGVCRPNVLCSPIVNWVAVIDYFCVFLCPCPRMVWFANTESWLAAGPCRSRRLLGASCSECGMRFLAPRL